MASWEHFTRNENNDGGAVNHKGGEQKQDFWRCSAKIKKKKSQTKFDIVVKKLQMTVIVV